MHLKPVMLTPTKAFEWSGCATGLAGAFLVALNNHYSQFGFVMFGLSNVCWLFVSFRMRMAGLWFMTVGYCCTTILGLYNWLR